MHAFNRTMLASLGFDDPDKKDARHDMACQYLAQPEVAKKIAEVVFAANIRIANEWSAVLESAKTSGEHAKRLINAAIAPDKPRFGSKDYVLASAVLEHHIVKGVAQYATTVGFVDALLDFDCHGFWVSDPRDKNWLLTSALANDLDSSGYPELAAALREVLKLPEDFGHLRFMDRLSSLEIRGPDGYFKYLHDYPLAEKALKILKEGKDHLRDEIVSNFQHWKFSWKSFGQHKRILVEVKIHPVELGNIIRQIRLYRTYAGQIDATVVASCFHLDAQDTATLASAGIHHVKLGSKFEEYVRARQAINNAGPAPGTVEI